MTPSQKFFDFPESIREIAWESVARERGLDPEHFPENPSETLWELLLESAIGWNNLTF
jgi:hypothetical protein